MELIRLIYPSPPHISDIPPREAGPIKAAPSRAVLTAHPREAAILDPAAWSRHVVIIYTLGVSSSNHGQQRFICTNCMYKQLIRCCESSGQCVARRRLTYTVSCHFTNIRAWFSGRVDDIDNRGVL